MTGRIKVNHGGNGADLRFYKPGRARKALRVPNEHERSAEFFRRRHELIRLTREAQEAAR